MVPSVLLLLLLVATVNGAFFKWGWGEKKNEDSETRLNEVKAEPALSSSVQSSYVPAVAPSTEPRLSVSERLSGGQRDSGSGRKSSGGSKYRRAQSSLQHIPGYSPILQSPRIVKVETKPLEIKTASEPVTKANEEKEESAVNSEGIAKEEKIDNGKAKIIESEPELIFDLSKPLVDPSAKVLSHSPDIDEVIKSQIIDLDRQIQKDQLKDQLIEAALEEQQKEVLANQQKEALTNQQQGEPVEPQTKEPIEPKKEERLEPKDEPAVQVNDTQSVPSEQSSAFSSNLYNLDNDPYDIRPLDPKKLLKVQPSSPIKEDMGATSSGDSGVFRKGDTFDETLVTSIFSANKPISIPPPTPSPERCLSPFPSPPFSSSSSLGFAPPLTPAKNDLTIEMDCIEERKFVVGPVEPLEKQEKKPTSTTSTAGINSNEERETAVLDDDIEDDFINCSSCLFPFRRSRMPYWPRRSSSSESSEEEESDEESLIDRISRFLPVSPSRTSPRTRSFTTPVLINNPIFWLVILILARILAPSSTLN